MTKKLIVPQQWSNTHAENKGFTTTKHGCLQAGTQFPSSDLRNDRAGDCLQKVAKMLWGLRQAMATQGWDDDNCMVVVEAQVRNHWYQVDGNWVEKDSPEWLAAMTTKTSIPT